MLRNSDLRHPFRVALLCRHDQTGRHRQACAGPFRQASAPTDPLVATHPMASASTPRMQRSKEQTAPRYEHASATNRPERKPPLSATPASPRDRTAAAPASGDASLPAHARVGYVPYSGSDPAAPRCAWAVRLQRCAPKRLSDTAPPTLQHTVRSADANRGARRDRRVEPPPVPSTDPRVSPGRAAWPNAARAARAPRSEGCRTTTAANSDCCRNPPHG